MELVRRAFAAMRNLGIPREIILRAVTTQNKAKDGNLHPRPAVMAHIAINIRSSDISLWRWRTTCIALLVLPWPAGSLNVPV